MPDISDAFIHVAVKCPICQRESRQRYLKSKLYTPVEVESDMHVVKYSWESPVYEGIRPNFYHLWHCPHCRFTDEKEVFRGEDDCGGKLELIREKILIYSKAPNSLITRLGKAIIGEQPFFTLENALCLHLLAIYLQEMLSANMRQHGKLGRFYLRLAWLYREKRSWQVPERDVPPPFASYGDFFAAMQQDWPAIPLQEETAIDAAIANYQEELAHSKRVDDIRFETNTMFLLAALHSRRDRLDDALACTRHIFQQANRKRQLTRQALDAAVNKGKATGQEIENLRTLVNWLNNVVERTATLNEELGNRIFDREYPRAREAVLAMPQPTPENILTHLHELKFHEVTCQRLAAMIRQKTLSQAANASPPADAHAGDKPKGLLSSIMSRLFADKGES